MFSISIESLGGKTESLKLKRFTAEMIPNLKRGIDRATIMWTGEIKKQLSIGGTAAGRIAGLRQPINPTNHLRVVSGDLRSSWTAIPAKATTNNVEGRIRTTVPYARIHELGGVTGRGGSVTLIPRPYIGPALEKIRDDMRDAITKELLRPLR